MIKKPFHELVQGKPQAHLDHLAFLEKRSTRDADRQVNLDEAAEAMQKKWEDKRKHAADEHSTQTLRRREKKAKHQLHVSEVATERREQQQHHYEEKEKRVKDAVDASVRSKSDQLANHSARLKDAHGRVLKDVKVKKLKSYDGGQDDVQNLIGKLHCFPQKRLDPIAGASYNVSYNASLTPRPPGAQKAMPNAVMPPLPSYASPTQASMNNASPGRGAVTQRAIDAAKEWVAYKRSFEDSPYKDPVQMRPAPPADRTEAGREASPR